MEDHWTRNNLTKPQSVIVCAACIVQDEETLEEIIICGARHWDKIMHKQEEQMDNVAVVHRKQGFINQFGEYLTREEALQVVLANGQPFNADRNGSDTELYSEGLY